MRCVTVQTAVLALLGALVGVSTAQYLNNRPYPTYSLEQMPDTGFSCRDKVLGGYYADSETQCQMFHICVKVAGLGVQDFRFLCPNGTAFDQDNQICAEWDDVDCEAATLYYSSDNFDLYRVGSGYETAAFGGEDEATFHLQRSETGDQRLIREHQSQRVNQQTNYNTAVPPRRPSPAPQGGERDRDILRASQSGNFFNNRNGGKEPEEDYYEDRQANQNQDVPKKKVVRKFNQRKPAEEDYEQPQTQRPQRPTGFANNFAGSIRPSSTTTPKPTTVEQFQEPRRTNGRNRAYNNNNQQYNNAENFRQQNNQQNNDFNRNQQNNDYNRNQQISTPAPFRAPDNNNNNNNNNNNRQYKNTNRQTTQYDNYPTTVAPKQQAVRQNFNQQPKQTENYPSTPAVNNRQNYNQQPKQTENYPSTPAVKQQFSTQAVRQNFNNQQQFQKQTDNYPSTPAFKQPENYPTTPVKQQTYKQTENYPTTPVKQQFYQKQTENNPSTPVPQNYYKKTDNYPTTIAKTENYPSTVSPIRQQTQQYKKETENYPTTNQQYNKQYDVPKKTTQLKQTENYPTTFAPSKQTYQKATTQYYQTKDTENYPSNNPKQSTQQYNSQFDNTRQFQTQQYSTTIRPTTQHTQYTPTVPKQTTQFFSTTPSARFSKQFDETQYDDGSYSSKYDNDKHKEDEFLKTAHSQNFASARNELLSSTSTKGVTTQSPRPFSVTTPIPRVTNQSRQTPAAPRQTQAAPKQTQPVAKTTQPQQPAKQTKKEKDVSYDYAYYDSNVGSEPDYDIGTEFAKSTKKN